MTIKRFVILICSPFFLFSYSLRADEGMWLPHLLKQLNEKDMQAAGMKLKAEDIYSVNAGSLKDAVISFGGFCTGEIVSDKGLLFTNHHCGIRQIQFHSTVEKDYITNGFWAMNAQEELPCPGLTATFIIRIEDVTQQIKEVMAQAAGEDVKRELIKKRMKEIGEKATENTHYGYSIRSIYNNNEYLMFITETFTDVRLVGAPPSSLGNFGKDTDNWMWPRHTADFAVFRIYAGKDNKPALYSVDNVPFKPRHFFPISMSTLQEEDFTLVFGFPGRTQQYLTSSAIQQVSESINPVRIKVRDEVMETWLSAMRKSDEVRIKYTAKYAGKSNYHKKWQGENAGIKRLQALEKKLEMEKAFQEKAAATIGYENILPELHASYKAIEVHAPTREYYNEVFFSGIELFTVARYFYQYANLKPAERSEKKMKETLQIFFKDYDAATDRKLAHRIIPLFQQEVEPGLQPALLRNKKGTEWIDALFEKSAFADLQKSLQLVNAVQKNGTKALRKEPAYFLFEDLVTTYDEKVYAYMETYEVKIEQLMQFYVQALRELLPDYRKYYPDANSTLRVAYGNITGSSPRDAIIYHPFTYAEGLLEKYIPGNYEFDLPPKLIQLIKEKDFGKYADDGRLRLCFSASNHTTGGNSGSPVINAKGELIGINFDRSWESTMSDIIYDKSVCRNIAVNIKYVLFVIDKFAEAGYLLDEMKLVTN